MYFQSNEDYGAKGFFVEGFTSFFSSDFDFEDVVFRMMIKKMFLILLSVYHWEKMD